MRREYRIPASFVSRFVRAAEAGPVEGSKARQLPIWSELALVLGFQVATVEPAGHDPRFFTAEEMRVCTAESAGGVRCPRKVTTRIGGEDWCGHHAAWIEEDAARALDAEARDGIARTVLAQQADERRERN